MSEPSPPFTEAQLAALHGVIRDAIRDAVLDFADGLTLSAAERAAGRAALRLSGPYHGDPAGDVKSVSITSSGVSPNVTARRA